MSSGNDTDTLYGCLAGAMVLAAWIAVLVVIVRWVT